MCPEAGFDAWTSEDLQGGLLRCDRVPELCDLRVDSVLNEPDLAVAIDVVIVSDGYTDTRMPDYKERSRQLVEALSGDGDGIVGRAPGLFNFHRVDLPANDASVRSRPLRSCASVMPGARGHFLVGDDLRATRAAANAPDIDIVIVLVDGSHGARSADSQTLFGDHVVRLGSDESHRVVTHEMAHALVGLGDEYVEFAERHFLADTYVAWTRDPMPPNLSLSPQGKWPGLVEGAVEGGGRYATGVYRPTENCRMRDARADIQFCPVCSAVIDATIQGRRGHNAGPPECGLAVGPLRGDGLREALVFARDPNGVNTLRLRVDGADVFSHDIETLQRPESGLPPWFEMTTAISGVLFEAECTDAAGESNRAVLNASDGPMPTDG